METSAVHTSDHVILTIKGTGAITPRRKPMHFIFVLDVSGSMEDEYKLSNSIRSIEASLQFINEYDYITIIAFNHHIKVIAKKIPATERNKEKITNKLIILVAEGSTSISAVIEYIGDLITGDAGGAEGADMNHGIIFLTDGHPTDGELDYDSLAALYDEFLSKAININVSAIGYGTDHNAHFLKYMAQEGGGTYSIVNNILNVASVFGYVIASLISVTCWDVAVIPSGLVPMTAYNIKNNKEIALGNIASEQAVRILFRKCIVGEKMPAIVVKWRDVDGIIDEAPVNITSAGKDDIEMIHLEKVRYDIYKLMKNMSLGEIRGADIHMKKDSILKKLSELPSDNYDVKLFKGEVEAIHPLALNRELYTQKSMCIGHNKGVTIIDGSAVIQSPTPLQEYIVNSVVKSASQV